MSKILLLGANSAIVQAIAEIYARQGHSLFLVGRDAERLSIVTAHLKTLSAQPVFAKVIDLNSINDHAGLLAEVERSLGGIDIALLGQGYLGDQAAAEKDWAEAEKILTTNFTAPASLLALLANYFQERQAGVLAAIGSVAGNRGRQSNYVYGTAKGALDLYLQGLRNRLFRHGVAVVTIKPGFVSTPMTAHLKKNALFATPEKVAGQIVQAIGKRKDIVYVPGFWRLIMTIIGSIPETVFKRLKL